MYYNQLKNQKVFFVTLLVFYSMTLLGQKLPNIQFDNYWIYNSIKVDGKISDWPQSFRAHNSATDLFYTIANDQNYLYITFQERIPSIISNIFNGGITLTIKQTNRKEEKGIAITYPVSDPKRPMYFNIRAKPKILDSTKSDLMKLDSFIQVCNTRISERLKNVNIKNINGLDSVLSIYNDQGIKASSLFDSKMYYNIELAISLENLALSIENRNHFFYLVKINEVEEHGITVTTDPKTGQINTFLKIAGAQVGQDATYFSGEYTLAKKP